MFLYFFISSDLRYIKIGRTKSISQRYNDIKRNVPFDLNIVAFFPIAKYKEEKNLLLKISEFRVNNKSEWFCGSHYENVLSHFVCCYKRYRAWPKNNSDELYGLSNYFLNKTLTREELIKTLEKEKEKHENARSFKKVR